MTLKTDKRSSLDHVMHYIDRKAEFGKTIPVAKAKRAAQYAFNAGRESVVENIPKLEWREVFHKDRSYFAAYSLGLSYKIEIEFVYNEFQIFCNYNYIAQSLSLSEAKQAANIHYKQRIKKALGI